MNKDKQIISGNENDASRIASQEAASSMNLHGEMVDLTCTDETVFGRSGLVQRTPPPNKTETEVNSGNTGKGNDALPSSDEMPVTERPCTPVNWTEQEELLQRGRSIISKMKAATRRQTNVSNDIKLGLVELEELFSAMAHGIYIQRRSEAEPAKVIELHQNVGTPEGSQKRPATSPADLHRQQEKRVRDEASHSAVEGAWEKQRSKREKRRENLEAKAAENVRTGSTKSTTNPPVSTSTRPAVTTQVRSRKGKRRRPRKGRPDALLIRPAEGKSYSEILREIRSKVKPEETEADIMAIRQTRAGGVLLELGPNSKNKGVFCGALKVALGDKASVVSLESKISLEIRDLDCFTEREEVETAVKREFPDVEELKVSVFPSSRDQKVAVVEIPDKWALKLLSQGRIKIGWLYCRVRRRAVVTRCYKCSGYGHIAKDCKGPDRSKLCYRCLESGHKEKTCSATIPCVLCTERKIGSEDICHVPGSGKCTVYREALQAVKNRLR